MRTAAGRRALQVVLLVGGLFALGFLSGEQAHAADGAASAPVTEVSSVSAGGVRALTSGAVAGVTHTPADAAPAKPAAPRRPADEVEVKVPPLSGAVPDSPSRPDGADAADVVDAPALPDVPNLPAPPDVPALSDLAGLSKLPPLQSLPSSPSLPPFPAFPPFPSQPSVPTVPSTPTLPGLPQLPGAPSLPVHTLPIPVTPAPQPGSPTAPTAPTAQRAPTVTDGQTPDGRSDAATPLTYGPRSTADADVTGVVARTPAHRAARPGRAPAHQEPSRDPGGALSGKAAGDSGTGSPRHGGDAHAVTFDHRAPLRLVPGAAVGADAYGTRDRHRDIPVSPA